MKILLLVILAILVLAPIVIYLLLLRSPLDPPWADERPEDERKERAS